ncbi:hypothetical protein [Streptomyces jumonjinensis]|uniref:Uncharacterized protein n=1 Tax=Streptomyces jumonjinensis TaxID=1945 RepID=A0A646KSG4_STRJU|nr:hypothetical protein [Streptomyces jumonjinensis]MQT05165.1 hypothetical protein [Streptomyces jumonjinensis]
MIPNTQPYVAISQYESTTPDGVRHVNHFEDPVVAWDDEGYPLVVSQQGLCRASDLPHFSMLSKVSRPIGALPADGWRVEHTNEDGTIWSEPLVGWLINADGTLSPLESDDQGRVHDVYLEYDRGAYRIYHPDSERPLPTGK